MTAWQERPAWRRGLLHGLAALAALLLPWLAGLAWFATAVPTMPADDGAETDAIVVLTGGSERLAAGLHLLADRRGRKLFVSGVYRGVEVNELLRLSRQAPEKLECCIVLGYTADNTYGNAVETARWMAAEKFTSLRLVTANYHMRRSLVEFEAAMPQVKVIAHPVFPDAFKHDEWWMWPGTAALVTSEYMKWLVARARSLLPSREEPS